jgi:uncharacterized repeat protein (TIGR03806 family)
VPQDRRITAVLKLKKSIAASAAVLLLASLALTIFSLHLRASNTSSRLYGLTTKPNSKPYLGLPELASGKFPPLLSQTGSFADVRALTPNPNLIPYELVVSFWSDGASKSRWVSLPDEKIKFSAAGEWAFPNGTVFVKEFDLPVDDTNPAVKRRLETRFLVRDHDGGVYGVSYKWRPDHSDADLLATSVTEDVTIKTASGTRMQTWYYPSREDCLTCHTANAGGVLGVKTRQMNREMTYPSGITDNELRAWNHAGIFDSKLTDSELAKLPKLANADDQTRTLEDRARSYLDANCSQCHRPSGTVAAFDARYDTPLAKQGLIRGSPLLNEGIDKSRIVAPNDIWRSILFMRVNTTETFKMPPLARMTVDRAGVELLGEWIHSLPGAAVLDPPDISPVDGNFDKTVTVTIAEKVPGSVIHFTTDGSDPTTSDPVYDAPFQLSEPTVIRARAFKEAFTRSIVAQRIYVPKD